MINIKFKKGDLNSIILLEDVKYLVGFNSIEKLRIFRLFDEFNTNLSNKKQDYFHELKLYINEKPISQKNINIIKIDYNFALYQNFKMQANSTLLKSLNYQLSRNDYTELFETIEDLLFTICSQFNETSNIKLINSHFTYSQFLKLVDPLLIVEDESINEFDLSIQDFILLQLDIIKPIVENNDMLNIILIDFPVINSIILDEISSIKNAKFIIKCDLVNVDDNNINNFMFVNDFIIDLADEDVIYSEICCNLLNNSNIEEGYSYMKNLIKNKIYTINLKNIK